MLGELGNRGFARSSQTHQLARIARAGASCPNGWTRIVQAALGIAAQNAGQDLLLRNSNGPYPHSLKRRDRRSNPGLIGTLTFQPSEPTGRGDSGALTTPTRKNRIENPPTFDPSAP